MFNVVIDTSIIISHLRGISGDLGQLLTLKDQDKITIFIPHIVIVELFAGQEAKKKTDRQRLEKIIEKFASVELSVESAKQAGDLVRIYSQIPDANDLIIAAIAMEQEAQIATHNRKHFEQIRGVKLFVF